MKTYSDLTVRMALLEAIDSVKVSLDSYKIRSPYALRMMGTKARDEYSNTVKEYKRRLAEYRKLLKHLGGKVRGDSVSSNALRRATQ